MFKSKFGESYTLIFENGLSIQVLKRSANDKFYTNPASLNDKEEEIFAKCLELGSVRLNDLCKAAQEIFKSKIKDIQ